MLARSPMALTLIHGPPNSGRAGRLQALFGVALERDPVLVLPTRDDVYRFERLLCASGAALGGSVLTFGDLFREVGKAAGASGGDELTPAQRLGAVSAGIATRRGRLGPLRRSAARPGFAIPFERLLDEMQGAGLDPGSLSAAAQTLESSAYLGDLAELFAAYAEARDGLGRRDEHDAARTGEGHEKPLGPGHARKGQRQKHGTGPREQHHDQHEGQRAQI